VAQVRDVGRFIQLLRRERIQVLLSYCMFQNILAALSWRLGGASVFVWGQRDEGRQRHERWVERLAVWQTPLFASNSAHGAQFLTSVLGAPPRRVHVVHNGVEPPRPVHSRAEWRSRLGFADNVFLACMVANLHRFKDHPTLIRAWRTVVDRMRQHGAQAHLLLAGAFLDAHVALLELVSQLRLENEVHFLDEVDDVAGLLAAVDLGVFSSFAEGVPNGVLECMAAGLPVVGADHPGIREAVGPDAAHLLAVPRDPEGFAEKILLAALDPASRRRLGEAGRARVAQEFTVEKMREQTVALILAELSRRRRLR
jgi:glycosyltransferase involved in cell wall biosynthesis